MSEARAKRAPNERTNLTLPPPIAIGGWGVKASQIQESNMDPAITSALISGGTKLLGGILGKGKKPQQNFREERQNLRNIVRGAKEAGFNPLTVLKATGGQPTANNIVSPLGIRAALGEAIETFGGTYAQNAMEIERENRAQEAWKDRYDYELENPMPPLSGRTTGGAQGSGATGNTDAEPLLVAIEMPDGSVREVPVGPDLDEMVTGGAIFVYDKGRDLYERWLETVKGDGTYGNARTTRTGGTGIFTAPPMTTGSGARRLSQ